MWKDIVLWLFVVTLGTAFGAGVYEARVVIPRWLDLPPSQWPNTGLLFWVYVTTVPLTLLTLFNAAAAWSSAGRRRSWHLAAVGIVIVERLATFSYFIPTMVTLMASDRIGGDDVRSALSAWLLLNHGRHVLTLAGWLAALRALSMGRRSDAAG
jgi:hypothetical protein